ncbi:HPr family phosphocarrier protein [Pelagibacterium sp.]|uniref:HPr family phosphocarrier protein n=1 Tax=Pelagibacterium sp. TaxID=1967288 RepID=UPI003BA92430
MSTTVTEPGRAVCQRLTICNKRGLHARASARFVRTADHFDAQVSVTRDGVTVGGTSIMGLMMLAAGPGSTILVQATGNQAREAIEALTELVSCGFDEDQDGEPGA